MKIPLVALVAALLVLMAFNQFQIVQFSGRVVSLPATQTGAQAQPPQSIDLAQYLPKGVPAVYGPELSVSYDDPVQSLSILSAMDADLSGPNPSGLSLYYANLSAEQKTRYLKIGSSIACEFCCGVKTLVLPNGQPSCGCSHSAAMRALAKYLLTKHPAEFTDDQILSELTKWKTLFFPQQMVARQLQPSGVQLPQMVGGC